MLTMFLIIRPLCAFALCLVAVSALAAFGAERGAPGDRPAALPSLTRAARTKTLTVGYFGGSITEGSGASDAAKTSWRARTTAYLRQKLPDVTVTEVNAAIGGTGSDLGAFRVQRDLLGRHPDLVFVEFAVNDFGRNEARILRSMEGIVRAIRKADRQTDIVFVYTATKKMDDEAYAQGKMPASVAAHRRVAAHYGIPEANIGEALARKVREDHGGAWKALTTDEVHPNDAGYAVYAERVCAFLGERMGPTSAVDVAAVPLPLPLTDRPLENGTMADAWDLPDTTGWEKDHETLARRFPHRLSANKPGTELRVPFTGDAIGLYWLIAPDSGDIEWRIDDGPWKRASSWDSYALHFTRANYVLLSDTLPPGDHELLLRVSGEKNPASTGTFIRIGAILVHGVVKTKPW
jgi:lysophospholipase L1-like esterase